MTARRASVAGKAVVLVGLMGAGKSSVGRRLARHLEKYESEFLRYLNDPQIPATNNTAEQTLRFAVLLRKVGCGNRTETGARTFEVLSSVSATFRHCGIDFLAWVSNLSHLGHPKLIPPELLPPGCSLQISYN